MDKVYTAWFSINGEDRYIYIPDSEVKYWEGMEGFDIRDESCICLEKEEVTPDQKIMVKMMDIIRRRSLQAIKKSKADEHGYRLLRANKRKREPNWKESWIIKKETPYSVEMSADVAYKLIEDDFYNFYNFVKKYSMSKLMNLMIGRDRNEIEEYLKKRDLLGKPLVLDIVGIEANYGKGVYEVTYWASDVI